MQGLKWYPEYQGNRDKPKAERITIELIPLSYEQMNQFNAMSRTWKDENKLGGVADNSDEITTERLKSNVLKIENLTDILSEKPINTVDELLKAHGHWKLVFEIEGALIDISTLKAGMEKNSAPPSDGSTENSLNGGIVNNAVKTG